MLKYKNTYIPLKSFAEQDYIDRLEKVLWKGKVTSPFDPTSEVYKCKGNRYKCKNTGKYFNAKNGTIFENSNLPLWKWFYALQMYSDDKRGISSHQLARKVGVTQKTAWFMLHRLRHSSIISLFKKKLENDVEIDETFIGGKNKNRHWDKKVPNSQGRSWKDKIVVWGGIQRGGNLIADVVPNNKKETLELKVRENVEIGSRVNSDEWLAYNGLGKWYKYGMVNHGKGQYVNGEAHVNTAESFNACVKGTIKGTYHNNISKKHAQKHIDEIVFRFNTRKWNEKNRFDLLLSSAIGKCLPLNN